MGYSLFSVDGKRGKNEYKGECLLPSFPLIGEYTYSGRDSLIFLVDGSRAMFESQSEDELTPFDMSIQVRPPLFITFFSKESI